MNEEFILDPDEYFWFDVSLDSWLDDFGLPPDEDDLDLFLREIMNDVP